MKNKILIPTLDNKKRVKSIKLMAEYYCLGFKIKIHDKIEVCYIWKTKNSIFIKWDSFLEECKEQYNILKKQG